VSKRVAFFQTSKVIVAVLRARVRRAIGGFIPLQRVADVIVSTTSEVAIRVYNFSSFRCQEGNCG
jgi:hypothetical protein